MRSSLPGTTRQSRVDGGVHDGLDPVSALGPHHDPAVAQRHPGAQELGAVADGVAQQLDVAAGRAGQRQGVAGAGRRPGLETSVMPTP